jgi:hypothetical protein
MPWLEVMVTFWLSVVEVTVTTNHCSLYVRDAIYTAAEQVPKHEFVSPIAVVLQRHLLPGGKITVGGVTGDAATTAQPALS